MHGPRTDTHVYGDRCLRAVLFVSRKQQRANPHDRARVWMREPSSRAWSPSRPTPSGGHRPVRTQPDGSKPSGAEDTPFPQRHRGVFHRGVFYRSPLPNCTARGAPRVRSPSSLVTAGAPSLQPDPLVAHVRVVPGAVPAARQLWREAATSPSAHGHVRSPAPPTAAPSPPPPPPSSPRQRGLCMPCLGGGLAGPGGGPANATPPGVPGHGEGDALQRTWGTWRCLGSNQPSDAQLCPRPQAVPGLRLGAGGRGPGSSCGACVRC